MSQLGSRVEAAKPRAICVLLWLVVLFSIAKEARADSNLVIPPGREAAVQGWLAPLIARGFAGEQVASISIGPTNVRLALGNESDVKQPCNRPAWGQGPSGLRLERQADQGADSRVTGTAAEGRIEVRWLALSWFACAPKLSEVAIRNEAESLAAALVRQDPDSIWQAPPPPGSRSKEPRPVQGAPHLLFAGLLALGGAVYARKRGLRYALLPSSGILLGLWARSLWHSPSLSAAWLVLPVLGAVAIIQIARHRPRWVWATGLVGCVALILRLAAPREIGNWYVDWLAPVTAAEAFNRYPGGVGGAYRLIALLIPITPSVVFAVSVLCSSAAVFFASSALALHSQRSAVWPKGTAALWGLLIAIDACQIRLGASDSPQVVGLFAFALGLWWYARLLSGQSEASVDKGRSDAAVGLIGVLCCSALVGLTRLELGLAPLVFPLLLVGSEGEKSRHTEPLLAMFSGLLAPLVVLLDRDLGGVFDVRGAGLLDFLVAVFRQSPWSIESGPLGPAAHLLLFCGFLLSAQRKESRRLFWVLAGYGVMVLPRLLTTFRLTPLGGVDPTQRYGIIAEALGLLLFALGAAGLWDLLHKWAIKTRRIVVGAGAALLVLVGLLWGGVVNVGAWRRSVRLPFQAEYWFLVEHLAEVPRGSTVVVVWRSSLASRDLDSALAAPHSLLAFARPDLRWVPLSEPGTPVPEGDWYYRGVACNIDIGSLPQSADQQVGEGMLRVCRDIESRLGGWTSSQEVAVHAATPLRLRGGVARLGLAPLAKER